MKQLISTSHLPAAEITDEVNRLLAANGTLVVTAPPGAGKSTLLPLTILQGIKDGTIPVEGRILMLEPRRIAARGIAERMSAMLGEKTGETVGYRIRFESKISDKTRIEVLTEGILTKIMTEDPTLDGVGVIIFDEFHERSLNTDTALALAMQTRRILRDDLRIVLMSATIDADALCRELQAPLATCEGRCYPVEIIYDDSSTIQNAILKALKQHDGDLLAFLPGEYEIRQCAAALSKTLDDTSIHVLPLYGQLPFEQQQRAVLPSEDGRRRIVLATPIAETSITIEGVRIVVDSGMYRTAVFDPQSGMDRLVTEQISIDMADQRAGRAGRLSEGVCYRLWSRGTHSHMAKNRKPQIIGADLSSTLLSVGCWGCQDISSLPWITKPEAASVRSAETLLSMMGALENGTITSIGRSLNELPCHPRTGRMLIEARNHTDKSLAADIAALLDVRDPMDSREMGADIGIRIATLRQHRTGKKCNGVWDRIEMAAYQYRKLTGAAEDNSSPDPYRVGALLAAAFPERIAKSSDSGCGKFDLACGDRASLDQSDALAGCQWMAIASLSSTEGGIGRIFLASPLDPSDLSGLTRERDRIFWDNKEGRVVARHERNIGTLLIESRPLQPSRSQTEVLICEAAEKNGESMLDFSDKVTSLQRRIATVSLWHPELELPDCSTAAVLSRAAEWLPMFLDGASSTKELKKIDLCDALWSMLTFDQQKEVDRLAPGHITVPTGSRIHLEYRPGAEAPVLRVRLQECFGMADTPKVDGGRKSVLMELLSPGYKPVQLTSDLQSFWNGTYFEVRKELRRRYPKHYWPDNPLEAQAVRGVVRKQI